MPTFLLKEKGSKPYPQVKFRTGISGVLSADIPESSGVL